MSNKKKKSISWKDYKTGNGRKRIKRQLKWYLGYPFRVVNKAWWWVKYHTTHRYHIIDVSGEDGYTYGWMDRDHVLMLACFKILKDFIELEGGPNYGLETLDSYKSPDHEWYDGEQEMIEAQIKRHQEVRALYDWWTKDRPQMHKTIDKYAEKNWWETQEKLDQIDEDMLIRLMKIRQCLWT